MGLLRRASRSVKSDREFLPATIARSVGLAVIAAIPIAIATVGTIVAPGAVIGAIVAMMRPITIGPMVTNRAADAGACKPVVPENMAGNTADNCALEAASGARRAR